MKINPYAAQSAFKGLGWQGEKNLLGKEPRTRGAKKESSDV